MMPVDYTTLSDPEKALAVDVKGVYPVVSVGRASDTGQLIMTCRVLALKRDVCRVPCHDGQLLASMSLWVPMFFDLLLPTSLATLQQALPQVVVNTWYTMADWLKREWSTWAPYSSGCIRLKCETWCPCWTFSSGCTPFQWTLPRFWWDRCH